jgi:4,5-DOPA dioxygenase extradiol
MDRLPALFISHGSPMFAVEPGLAGPQLAALGRALPRPRAVLVLSPHWITRGLRVATTPQPETIHDFGGFPPALYAIEYPAPGAPEVAQEALALLRAAGWDAQEDAQWGLDHGAWVPVRHLYPDADVPVLQVSMPHTLTGESAVALGRALAPLAASGVLLVGSGSITHNLADLNRWEDVAPLPYAQEFVAWARDAVTRHDGAALAGWQAAPHARRAHPTPEHYLPLPFAFGAGDAQAPVRVIDGGMCYGALAMDAYVFGNA